MSRAETSFEPSDAWLLLSVLYAHDPADAKRLREVGDFIGHAIFTDAELEGGLARLNAAGHVVQEQGRVTASRPVEEWFAEASPARSQVPADLERVASFLSISD